jgi:hypothetical protein
MHLPQVNRTALQQALNQSKEQMPHDAQLDACQGSTVVFVE